MDSLWQDLRNTVSARPGIESASLAEFVPLRSTEGRSAAVAVEGYAPQPDENMRLALNVVGADYFRTMRMDLIAGREFSQDDGPASPAVVIVNETMARRFWQTPARTVGQRIRLGDNDELTVVGVTRDIKYFRLNEEPRPYFYMPLAQRFRTEMTVHVRGATGTADLIGRVRAEVRSLDATVPALEAHTLADQARAGLVLYELSAAALIALGLIAIGLAAVGVYGLVSYSVKQSTHEIGVRIALGARRRNVVLRFLSGGMRLGAASTDPIRALRHP